MNRTATATSSRDISAQTTALLLSTLSITLATRTKSQFPPYRFRSLDSLTVMGQECESPLPSISPSLSPMHLGTPAAAYSHIQSPTPVAISTPTEQASYNYFSTAKKVHSYNNYNEKPIYTITLYTAS